MAPTASVVSPSSWRRDDSTIYLSEPPPGEQRVAHDPPSSAGPMIVVGIVTSVLSVIFVILRYYTKICITKTAIAIEDHLLLTATIFSLAELANIVWLMSLGFGWHEWQVTLAAYSPYFLIGTSLGTIFYAFAIVFSKLSLLFLYLRLSPDRMYKRIIWTLITITIGYASSYVFSIIFSCVPVAASWDVTIKNKKCLDKYALYTALGVLNIIMDGAIFVVPVKIVWNLNVDNRQKASVILLFSSGIGVCVWAILRLVYLRIIMSDETDYTWNVTSEMPWAFLEMSTSIFCACVPTLKPLVKRHLPFIFGNGSGVGSKRLRNGKNMGTATESRRPRDIKLAESYGLTSVAEQNRKRRTSRSVKDISTPGPLRTPGRGMAIAPHPSPFSDLISPVSELDEDQQKLWSVRGGDKPGENDMGSVSSSEPGGMGDGRGRAGTDSGIRVTKETLVTFQTNHESGLGGKGVAEGLP